MTDPARQDMTALLEAVREGREHARDELVTRIYDELRVAARAMMRRERRDHTLQPTALVNDALCRLLGADGMADFENRAHLFGAAASAMHRVLVDHARARGTRKRGGGHSPGPLDAAGETPDPAWEAFIEAVDRGEDILALDAALRELAELSERQHGVFMLHYYGGLTGTAIAELLKISKATVDRDLRIAKAWLRGRLSRPGS